MESQRQLKISKLIQKDLGEIFQMEGRNYGGVLITVTKVKVTRDLGLARVYLSLFATPDKEILFEKIKLRTKEIRHQLAQRVKHQLRTVPVLQFFMDDSLDYIENIDKLLKE
ncbi:MAG: 30S ribosome-binding factor RbfA [Saprospiraceae bacterium]|nr:30S ribosome-binding factor RbfA [Saprospiraceae bacterium]